ncbi:MAG: hypothetical protein IPK58_10665 [Acidobacteria bacterium]|nr:hypothetical protein [Acidobacteriota bacterium]
MSGDQGPDGISGLLLGSVRRFLHTFPDWKECGAKRSTLTPEVLSRRIVVIYTGEPRNSGTNNWEITKRHIDGDAELIRDLRRDSRYVIESRGALLANDWQAVGEHLKSVHLTRKRMPPNITIPQMDKLDRRRIRQRRDWPRRSVALAAAAASRFSAKTVTETMTNVRALRKKARESLEWAVSGNGSSGCRRNSDRRSVRT